MKRLIKSLIRMLCTAAARLQTGGMGKNCCVNFPCKFTKNTFVGSCSHFNGINISGSGRVTIGSYFHSGKHIRIITSFHNYDRGNAIPYDETMVTKDVTIDDCVWLGERVLILGGVHIGEGAVLQAGSVVVRDIPPYAIAGGAPAQVFKYRDMEHYERLKAEGRFSK